MYFYIYFIIPFSSINYNLNMHNTDIGSVNTTIIKYYLNVNWSSLPIQVNNWKSNRTIAISIIKSNIQVTDSKTILHDRKLVFKLSNSLDVLYAESELPFVSFNQVFKHEQTNQTIIQLCLTRICMVFQIILIISNSLVVEF